MISFIYLPTCVLCHPIQHAHVLLNRYNCARLTGRAIGDCVTCRALARLWIHQPLDGKRMRWLKLVRESMPPSNPSFIFFSNFQIRFFLRNGGPNLLMFFGLWALRFKFWPVIASFLIPVRFYFYVFSGYFCSDFRFVRFTWSFCKLLSEPVTAWYCASMA